ncbi:MAG: Re/Si-specific NAD(P)(+) transhydrogenase subunit alpha [Alphaproteobacteria bacterium]|nr:Re/Si-specific NAD(P)(+) transhydrogenase subunit alpha [Alphaproteobacteria bacterium]
MKLAIIKERQIDEARVAVTPDVVKKLLAMKCQVVIEAGAGMAASYTDEAYRAAGAEIAPSAEAALKNAEILWKIHAPTEAECKMIPANCLVMGILAPYQDGVLARFNQAKLTAFSMELVPRITRAQTMDVLSSQANLAGYRAVIDAAAVFGRAFPMMMTAAGTIPPARVLVMGAGVAGLQAIATARRLGGMVSATDVRLATKEQVQSLGATFVAVENEESRAAETSGGYAKEMSDDYKKLQAALIAETVKKQDIVICTALIPGRKAPTLLSKEMIESMKPGSVIVDLAVEQGGNCPLSSVGKIVDHNGVKILGYANMPGRVAFDASALYARNLLAFFTPLVDAKAEGGAKIKLNLEDEIVKATLLTQNGQTIHPNFAGK